VAFPIVFPYVLHYTYHYEMRYISERRMYMTHKVRFMGINRDTETAGPGKRLEFFTKGCIRGVISPCQGCFNESTWTFAGQYREMSVEEIVEVALTSWNRQITFCGGEPILQAKALAEVAKRLKAIDPTFHFVMYTAYKLDTLMKHGLKFTWVPKYGKEMEEHLSSYSSKESIQYNAIDEDEVEVARNEITILTSEDVQEIMQHIDLIVDGDYQFNKRLTTAKYMHNGWFVGSSNQRVIDAPASVRDGELHYLYADEYNRKRLSSKHCRCCGHEVRSNRLFCNDTCASRYSARKKELERLGVVQDVLPV
jgi:organic radical activating enzyme